MAAVAGIRVADGENTEVLRMTPAELHTTIDNGMQVFLLDAFSTFSTLYIDISEPDEATEALTALTSP